MRARAVKNAWLSSNVDTHTYLFLDDVITRTQAEVLAKALGIPAISTGEMLRQAVAAGSELGGRVEGIMAAGKLVDDALMAEVVADRLARPDAAAGFLLDGYPRTPPQAVTLDELLADPPTSGTTVYQ